tara:strand:+ start:118 stop:285 length:168 start_codon:yes stop_codon:yes gene_type:complete
MVTPKESLVFSHYLMKYNLLKIGFGWHEIDELSTKEVEIIMSLYGALSTKEQGFG